MKLYNLPRKSYFLIEGDDQKEMFFFDHLDGMYSYCLDSNKNVIHLSATTPVIPVP